MCINNCDYFNVNLPDTLEIVGFQAFEDCRGLTSITIPDSVVYIEVVNDYGGAFRGNENLVATFNGVEYKATQYRSGWSGYDLPEEFYEAVNSR